MDASVDEMDVLLSASLRNWLLGHASKVCNLGQFTSSVAGTFHRHMSLPLSREVRLHRSPTVILVARTLGPHTLPTHAHLCKLLAHTKLHCYLLIRPSFERHLLNGLEGYK